MLIVITPVANCLKCKAKLQTSLSGDLARFQTDIGAAGLGFIHPGASFLIAGANDIGVFDFYYNGLDYLYNEYGIYTVTGLYIFPVFIPTRIK